MNTNFSPQSFFFLGILLRFVELDSDDSKGQVNQEECSDEDDHDEVECEKVVEGILHIFHEKGPPLQCRDDVDVEKSIQDIIEV